MKFLNTQLNLERLAIEKKVEYEQASPFPHIVFDEFFDHDMLSEALEEFPDLSRQKEIYKYENHNEKKYAAKGEAVFGPVTKQLMHFLNSQPMLEFLQTLTGIKETLIPDPYFVGGGCHEIKPGGLLKVHADFNKHEKTSLDRRINLLIYLNKDWEEQYGGHFELWDKNMTTSVRRVLPAFNRVAIFSTTDFAYHGHPDPLTCPDSRSRKSLALYYYSNGRPESEITANLEDHTTIFVPRKGKENDVRKIRKSFKTVMLDYIPPILIKLIKKKY